jgi:hypothetical protein
MRLIGRSTVPPALFSLVVVKLPVIADDALVDVEEPLDDPPEEPLDEPPEEPPDELPDGVG